MAYSQGHQLALEWFEQFQPLIRQALASRAPLVADIDDLVQEVYLRMLRIPDPELVQDPQAYLYRVAQNVAEEWRQRSARHDHSEYELAEFDSGVDLEKEKNDEECKDRIDQALSRLTLASRTAVILHMRDGMTYGEIATHMGVTRRAVKRYMANGYKSLRKDLNVFATVKADGAFKPMKVRK